MQWHLKKESDRAEFIIGFIIQKNTKPDDKIVQLTVSC